MKWTLKSHSTNVADVFAIKDVSYFFFLKGKQIDMLTCYVSFLLMLDIHSGQSDPEEDK